MSSGKCQRTDGTSVREDAVTPQTLEQSPNGKEGAVIVGPSPSRIGSSTRQLSAPSLPFEPDPPKTSKAPFANCSECPLLKAPMVPGEGPDTAKFVIIGEGPGREEVSARRPFVGRSGILLRGAAKVANVKLDRAWITNATLCPPPQGNKKVLNQAAKCCHERLIREVAARKPRAILAVGDTAMKAMGIKGQKMSISRVRGMIFTAPEVEFSAPDIKDANVIPFVVPCLHPAFILRDQQDFTPVLVTDLARAARLAEHGRSASSYPIVDLEYMPKAVEHALRTTDAVAVDIETMCGRGCTEKCSHAIDIRTAMIRTIGFAWRANGQAISTSFEWSREVAKLTKWLWQNKHVVKVFHNMGFDVPILERILKVWMR